MTERLLRTSEVAERLRVSPKTVGGGGIRIQPSQRRFRWPENGAVGRGPAAHRGSAERCDRAGSGGGCGGLRELAEARLLAEDTPGLARRLRHALLAEAVAAQLLPGEREGLHEQIALAFEGAHDDTLAAEIAGHWATAGQPARELPPRVAAARPARSVTAG
jgi:hypothetical protein